MDLEHVTNVLSTNIKGGGFMVRKVETVSSVPKKGLGKERTKTLWNRNNAPTKRAFDSFLQEETKKIQK